MRQPTWEEQLAARLSTGTRKRAPAAGKAAPYLARQAGLFSTFSMALLAGGVGAIGFVALVKPPIGGITAPASAMPKPAMPPVAVPVDTTPTVILQVNGSHSFTIVSSTDSRFAAGGTYRTYDYQQVPAFRTICVPMPADELVLRRRQLPDYWDAQVDCQNAIPGTRRAPTRATFKVKPLPGAGQWMHISVGQP